MFSVMGGEDIAKLSPQLQVKLILKAELALISVNPATHPPTPHPRPGKYIFQQFLVNVNQVTLQEDTNWKTTSTF